MRHGTWALVALIGVALMPMPRAAEAASPTEQLRGDIADVLALLRDGTLRSPEATQQRRSALRRSIEGVLDFPVMAERALGRHWSARTPEERTEFVRVFGNLLEGLYVTEIERHADQSVTYLRESVAGDEATVETNVGAKTETRVDYRMHRRNGRWRVHDVLVGGLSVVDNFRSQLQRVLRDSPYAVVMEKLREATGGQATPVAAPR